MEKVHTVQVERSSLEHLPQLGVVLHNVFEERARGDPVVAHHVEDGRVNAVGHAEGHEAGVQLVLAREDRSDQCHGSHDDEEEVETVGTGRPGRRKSQ